MSQTMHVRKFIELLNHIKKEHSFGDKGKTVKYIDPHFDNRTGDCFSVTFRGYGWDKTLHCVNECRDLEKSLFERCMEFLDDERHSEEWVDQ